MVILKMNLGTRSPRSPCEAADPTIIIPAIRVDSWFLAAVDWSGCLAAKDLV
jgi:hypothetical protein